MLDAVTAACLHHPEREAMGICVRCRVRYCSECITKLDGINHCAACVAERAALEASSHPLAVQPRFEVARTLASFAILWAVTWFLLSIALPGSV